MDRATDGHVAFYTTLQLTTKQGIKSIMVKIDARTMANIIPLSKYHKMFPHEVTKSGNPKQGTLQPISY